MYEKRLCILKQLKKGFSADGAPLTGAVYAEWLNGDLTVTPRIAGLAPLSEGRYALAVRAGGKDFCLELKGNEALRIPDAPHVRDGFAALLCYVRGEAEPIAYGFCGGADADHLSLLSVFGERKRPVPMPPNEVPGAPSPQVPLAPGVHPMPPQEGEYNDEALAAEDYFLRDESSSEGSGDSEKGKSDLSEPPFLRPRGLTYYYEIEEKLKEAFARNPRDDRLLAAFPNSQWVKTESALLGILYEEGLPRYLCVAMEQAPPKEVGEYSVFVPLGPYSDESGFFVVFQDADTGEYVKTYEA